MVRKGSILLAVLVAASVAATAQASRFMRVGIYDEAQTLYGPVDKTFAMFKQLHVQEVRLNLYWGGRFGVAKSRPASATNPADPAYDWDLYDRTVNYAAQNGVHVLFSIYGTPSWANGGQGPNVAPTRATDLRNFAYAAARRYGGTYPGSDGRILPAVREWLAWNEPNNPLFLTPQYRKTAAGPKIQSAVDYAKICNAVYSGVHATLAPGERVGCGVTGPRGNNNPNSARPSVSPLAFLRASKAAGLKSFDAWAHHPYYAGPSDQPTTKPVTAKGAPATAVCVPAEIPKLEPLDVADLARAVLQLRKCPSLCAGGLRLTAFGFHERGQPPTHPRQSCAFLVPSPVRAGPHQPPRVALPAPDAGEHERARCTREQRGTPCVEGMLWPLGRGRAEPQPQAG